MKKASNPNDAQAELQPGPAGDTAEGAGLAADELQILGHPQRLTCLEGCALQFGVAIPVWRYYTAAEGKELDQLRAQMGEELAERYGPESEVQTYQVQLDMSALIATLDKTGAAPVYFRRIGK